MPVTRSALASSAARSASAGAGVDLRGDVLGQAPQPPHPVALAAQLGVEGDMLQPRHAGFQPRLAVQVPEMPRVGEAGAQHAFVAGDDGGAAVRRLDVGDEGEPGRGAAVGGAQREIALVDPHGDLHDLRRQVHVFVGDAPEQGDRPFHQAGDLVEQAGIVHHGKLAGGGKVARCRRR